MPPLEGAPSCGGSYPPRRGDHTSWVNRTGGSAPVPNGSGAHDASDEHSGAEVCAAHRPHLGAEQWTRAEDLGALSDQMLGVLGRLCVLHDPVRCAAVVQLIQVGVHPLQCPLPRSDTPDGGDLGAEGQDRFDLQRRPEHRLCRPDASAAAQIFESVQAKPDLEALAGFAHGIDHGVQLRAFLGRARGSDDEAAQTAGAGLAVDDLYAPGMPFLGQGARRLSCALARPRDAGSYVNGDHIAPCNGERLVAGAKVSHRRLRGRWQRRGFAQPRIEGIEVVVLMLGPQVTIPAHIQADLANPPPVDQPPRQVRRAVGHHGDTGPRVGGSDVSRGPHARAKPTGLTPPEQGPLRAGWSQTVPDPVYRFGREAALCMESSALDEELAFRAKEKRAAE